MLADIGRQSCYR